MAKKKKSNPAPEVDPAFLACFETAILDYDILTKQVEDKGMVLKHRNDHKRLKARGEWNAPAMLANYTAVCSKMSKHPRSMRDFIEYIGDNASAYWIDAERKAMERMAEAKPSKEAESPEG